MPMVGNCLGDGTLCSMGADMVDGIANRTVIGVSGHPAVGHDQVAPDAG